MKLFRWKALHSYLALLVGLQFLLWVASGLALNLIDSQYFDANKMRSNEPQATQQIHTLAPLSDIAKLGIGAITQIKLTHILGRPTYQVETDATSMTLWADSLVKVTLTDKQLYQIANASYNGAALNHGLKLANHLASRYRTSAPVYRLTTLDPLGTEIIIDGGTGQVLAHENQQSHIKQWLLMVHFMDYFADNGLSFNHVIIQAFAIMALGLGLSGTMTLFGQLSRPNGTPAPQQTFTLYDHQDKQLATLAAVPGSILDNINQSSQRLQTHCGGGGSCGMCRVRIHHNPPAANEFDINKLSANQIQQGMRLACQHPNLCSDISFTLAAQSRYTKSA
ncbi:2Fe-2S iron-sulfur cluster-binding protein [Shewanella waksmanii]|uniref:2Fe-2S iron-sulfur cluster-binding protein n=1 Tax=Shewanella waksmanii TaxID=213783 RepID=UPI0004B8FCBD|nr:2Fe-2S iron-sulfur cluster-binding protein [Shewanella waksmanii]